MQGQDEAPAEQEPAAAPPASLEPAPPSLHDGVLSALKGDGNFAELHCEATGANLLGSGSFGKVRYLSSCTTCHCTPARHLFLARNLASATLEP